MFSTRAILLLSLFASSALASPIDYLSHLRAARNEAILYPRQDQSNLTQPVTFQTVTTSQSDVGTITTTCTVTLSPVTAADGSSQVLEEKECKIDLGTGGESSSASSSNGGGDNTSTASSTETATQSQETQTLTSSSALNLATAVPAISEIGVGSIPASATGAVSAPSSSSLAPSSSSSAPSSSSSASVTASGSAPLAVSVIGPGQIPASATGTIEPASVSSDPASSTDTASVTTLVTSVTTLSNGQISTSIITPSAAAAQEAAATTPGQKLEVLPIGLGVFAGVSVIALIVVGLVTYERTKYRKAFRQRKLAEAGANMGYGGMAERT